MIMAVMAGRHGSKVVILSLCSMVVSGLLPTDGVEQMDFDIFQSKFNRTYSKGSTEYEHRHQVFKQNVLSCAESNSQRTSPHDAQCGVTQFSDMTMAEFLEGHTILHAEDGSRCGGDEPPCQTKAVGQDLPEQWDWRQQGVVTGVRDQQLCGSCWAFGVVETIESHWAIRHGELHELSVQQLLDCTPHCSCKGCFTGDAFKWLVQSRTALELRKDNPYADEKKQCASRPTTNVRISNYSCCHFEPSAELTQLRSVLFQNGPFAIMINAASLKDYVGGIIQHHCPFKNVNGGYHSVVVVGYDMTGEVPYWIIRNSWGEAFGEEGYFRVVMGKSMCGLGVQITYPVI
ncbi:cathepsin O-like [Sycon ciliatum]|uniref:cathepsin O-like n=1 Tax=Sycon ciliatum TaxID=27933 RepID=UPI0031F6C3F6